MHSGSKQYLLPLSLTLNVVDGGGIMFRAPTGDSWWHVSSHQTETWELTVDHGWPRVWNSTFVLYMWESPQTSNHHYSGHPISYYRGNEIPRWRAGSVHLPGCLPGSRVLRQWYGAVRKHHRAPQDILWSPHLEQTFGKLPKRKTRGRVSWDSQLEFSTHRHASATGFKSSGEIFLATKQSRPVALCLGSTTGSDYCPPWRETEKLRKALQSRKDPEVAAWGEPCCPGLGVVLPCPSRITDPNNQDQILRQTYSSKIKKANIQITNKNNCLYWPKLSHAPVLV